MPLLAPSLPSVHDYPAILRAWRTWARARAYELNFFAMRDEHELFYLQPRRAPRGQPWWYFSAGIHGDEPAGVAGLLAWAYEEEDFFTEYPALIFPCLNPWGLRNNMRTDAAGRDLNRAYDDPQGPCAAHMGLLHGHRFQAACCLHEDYDANGIYLYELRGREPGYGANILPAIESILPRDTRHRIDGKKFHQGVLSRPARKGRLPLSPEAVYLRLNHTPFSFTFETPSEADITHRVQAQVAFLRQVTTLLG